MNSEISKSARQLTDDFAAAFAKAVHGHQEKLEDLEEGTLEYAETAGVVFGMWLAFEVFTEQAGCV